MLLLLLRVVITTTLSPPHPPPGCPLRLPGNLFSRKLSVVKIFVAAFASRFQRSKKKPQEMANQKFPCFDFFDNKRCLNRSCPHSHNLCDYKSFCASGRPRPDDCFETFLAYFKDIPTDVPTATPAEIADYRNRKREREKRKIAKLNTKIQRINHARSVLVRCVLDEIINTIAAGTSPAVVKQDNKSTAKSRLVTWGTNTSHEVPWSCPSRPGKGKRKRITVSEGAARSKAKRQRRQQRL